MSTAIIGISSFARNLHSQFISSGAETVLFAKEYEEIKKYDILLLADEPASFADTISYISPFLKSGQAIIIGNGSIFGTWTVTKALFDNKAPDRIIVGMCDAFNGNADCKTINLGSVQVSAHSFVYNQFLSYLCGELFETCVPAASPLALSLNSSSLGYELTPIAKEAGKIELIKQAVLEYSSFARAMGNERDFSRPEDGYNDIRAALHAAICNLYPVSTLADYLSLDAPALTELLNLADSMSGGTVSGKGKAFLPKPELLFGHNH